MYGILKNCRLLIIEDDDSLALRISSLFSIHTGIDPVIINNMEDAIDIVNKEKKKFDLAIVDIMLPSNDVFYKKVRELEMLLNTIQDELSKISSFSNEDNREKSSDLRYRRSQALKQLNEIVYNRNGIHVVEQWRKDKKNKVKQFPILFLTATGSDGVVREGLGIAGRYSDWAIKPAPSEVILEKSTKLLDSKNNN